MAGYLSQFKRNTYRCLLNIGQYLSIIHSSNEVSPPKWVSHSGWLAYLSERFNKEGINVLEIGSRKVTGAVFRSHFSHSNYVGFDIYDGDNVDIVGDAHKISRYFAENEKFDLIFSTAVFEHLYMPWVVAEQIQKMLKVDGVVFIETHFSYTSHERPWHFFQFSDIGLRALFNARLGFEVLDAGMCNPIRGYFGKGSEQYLRYQPVRELYCHSMIMCKKTHDVNDFTWASCDIDEIVNYTRYPPEPNK